MKTTVEITDELLRAVKRIAGQEGTTLRALIEEGLRNVLAARLRSGGFRLRDASVGGDGPHPGLREGDWSAIRDRIYDGRGG